MSVYIVISQSARLAAVWTKHLLTKQLLLSASIVAYSVLLMQRNDKINKYYERKVDELPENGSREDSEVS